MRNTLELMKSILNGKEGTVDEKELIKEYKEKLQPNILAYFYCNNYNMIYSISNSYYLLTSEDKASFCLQELDKCLRNIDLNSNIKFTTYFFTCYKYRLNLETKAVKTNKRKAMTDYVELDNTVINTNTNLDIEDIDLILENYNLSDDEKKHCKLLNIGYTLTEIAKLYNLSISTISQKNSKIKKKILSCT